MRKQVAYCLLLLICWVNGVAQDTTRNYFIKRIHENLTIDGRLSENAWQAAISQGNFWEKFPNDDKAPKMPSYIKLLYNDQFLYMGFEMKDSGQQFVTSLKRDMAMMIMMELVLL